MKCVPHNRGHEVAEERRPGVQKLLAEIQAKNPQWTLNRCLSEAKVQWEAQAKQKGQVK